MNPFWTDEDNRIAMSQGWILTNDALDRYTISKLDDPAAEEDLDYDEPKFASDAEAVSFVFGLAAQGQRHALKALYLNGYDIQTRYKDIYIDSEDWLIADDASAKLYKKCLKAQN